jgi:hypothetical protein
VATLSLHPGTLEELPHAEQVHDPSKTISTARERPNAGVAAVAAPMVEQQPEGCSWFSSQLFERNLSYMYRQAVTVWIACALAIQGVACTHQAELHVVNGTLPIQALGSLGDNHYDCDVPANHFSNWTHDVLAASGIVTGTAYFRAIRVPAEWHPAASITLRGKGSKESAGVTFIRFPQPPDSTAVHLLYVTPGGGLQRLWFDHRRMPLGSEIRFELRWAGNRLEMRLPPDTAWTPVPMAFAPKRLHLGCTSSEVIFHHVTISSPAPNAGSDAGPTQNEQAPTVQPVN